MSKFRLYLVLLFMPFMQPAAATAAEFKGVQELILVDKIDTSDLYNVSIIFQRCAGLFGAYAKFLPGDMKEQKEKLFMKSMEVLVVATQAMAKKRGLPLESEVIKNQVDKAFMYYVDIYYGYMEDSQIKTGSMFDEFTNGEQDICLSLTN